MGAPEAGHFVSLEVIQRDEDVGVHDGPSDLRFAYEFAVRNGHRDVVGSLEPVADDDVASRRIGGESIDVSSLDMFQRMLARTDVKRIAVGQERFAAARLDLIGDGAGEVRPQERQVAGFAEMNFDCGETILEIDFVHSGPSDQERQLLLKIPAFRPDSHIGEIYVCFFHDPGYFVAVL